MVWTPDFLGYHLSDAHPLDPVRLDLTMRLALNYQRVDPTRGGAETYVVDLCHRLVQAGHRVDLYADRTRRPGLARP